MVAVSSPGALAAAMVVAVSVAAAVAGVDAVSDARCKWSSTGTTYDLNALKNAARGYEVKDVRQESYSNNFTYIFNICGDIEEPPPTRRADGYPGNACNTTYDDCPYGGWSCPGTPRGEEYGPSPAFQVFNNDDLCHRLGNSYTNVQWGLYDAQNPSRGVFLEYQGGDRCPFDWGERALRIVFECSTDPVNPFSTEDKYVEEVDQCRYEIFTSSVFGCPAQCPVVAGNLCSAHGVCDFDTDLQASKCFCNPGYSGVDCSTVDEDGGLGAVGGILIFVLILLVLLLGVLGFLWTRIRTLRLDPKAYSALRGGGPGDDAEEGGAEF